jgi:hypothetical protein
VSFLAWIDFDQSDRDRAHRIMDLFSEEDSRDELGIGAVRDALSDLMFPGTSTIDALERGGETVGVIGSVARGALKRLPSDVYWAGLGILGIRRFQGTRSAYFELPAGEDAAGRLWAIGLPEPDGRFLESTSFRLTRDEADFVTDRLHDAAPASLFRELVRVGRPADCRSAWTHPLRSELVAREPRDRRPCGVFLRSAAWSSLALQPHALGARRGTGGRRLGLAGARGGVSRPPSALASCQSARKTAP